MIADLRVLDRGDHLVAEVAAGRGPALAGRFDQRIFSEDARVGDVSQEFAVVRVLGRAAPGLVAGETGRPEAEIASLVPLWQADGPADDSNASAGVIFVVRADDVAEAAFDVWTRAEERDALVQRLEARGAVALTEAFGHALRVAAGRPLFGVDMTEETIPLEAGLLDRAVSTSKGCYVGQEVIIRVLHRGGGRVAKKLVRLAVDTGTAALLPEPGATVTAGAADAGKLTSIAWSPNGSGAIGLAYVGRDVAETMPPVTIAASSGPMAATIVGLAG
jgi:folate-binding protein YgfZ